jgi:hypothetical protein
MKKIARFGSIFTAITIALITLIFCTMPVTKAQDKNKCDSCDTSCRIVKDPNIKSYQDYLGVVQKTVNMVYDQSAVNIARKFNLNILNVTWEDTGRYKGSCVGPNISDMTIQVQLMDPKTQKNSLYCMPVIRYPNYDDKSCDVKPENFYILVGNEKGKSLKSITLKQYLGNIRSYLTKPNSWKGREQSLLAKRDSHVLVSAQSCFLPIPKKGIAQFNPVLFNYQSYAGNPAVLAILATREGTSCTIIDNKRDAFNAGATWGQRLFFNQKGKRASLTGKRLSDYLSEKSSKGNKTSGKQGQSSKNTEGLNMVLLIQVPLKHKPLYRQMPCAPAPACKASAECESGRSRSDVESAVIGHSKVEGPFTEIDNLAIERDPNFPIRVTVQFYKATSNGVISQQDVAQISNQISKVYSNADYVGSLVTDGHTNRPTEYYGPKTQPPGWWNAFWNQYEKTHNMTREEAMRMLRELYGPKWTPRDEDDLRYKLNKINK